MSHLVDEGKICEGNGEKYHWARVEGLKYQTEGSSVSLGGDGNIGCFE